MSTIIIIFIPFLLGFNISIPLLNILIVIAILPPPLILPLPLFINLSRASLPSPFLRPRPNLVIIMVIIINFSFSIFFQILYLNILSIRGSLFIRTPIIIFWLSISIVLFPSIPPILIPLLPINWFCLSISTWRLFFPFLYEIKFLLLLINLPLMFGIPESWPRYRPLIVILLSIIFDLFINFISKEVFQHFFVEISLSNHHILFKV